MIMKYVAIQGTNNRPKFYALWIMMKIIVEKGIKQLHVFGDLKILMDWTNNKSRIDNIMLDPIMS
jgi:hypothetical protein